MLANDVDRINAAKRTSPCVTAVRNMGTTPRLHLSTGVSADEDEGDLPQLRDERNCMPSQTQARKLLSKCIELPRYAHWSFDDYFNKAALAGKAEGDVEVCCQTPVQWIQAGILGPNSSSVWHCQDVEITRMCEMGDMFCENGTTNPFHHEVFVMDVILNRAICEPAAPTFGSESGKKAPPVIDPDRVAMVRCFKPENLDASVDWKFRTMICYIPTAGVFYCVRERRKEDVGLEKTMIPFDMSWLRMRRHIGVDGKACYGFADGGYVRRFATRLGDNRIPVWRIRSCRHDRLERVIYRAQQCHDCEGPKMAPDVFFGECACSSKSQEALAADYNRHLANSNSAKANCRWYAPECHYSGRLPDNCMIIDSKATPCVDVVIDVAATGGCTDRQTVVMVRHLLLGAGDKKSETTRWISGCLRQITFINSWVRQWMGNSRGTVRASSGDFGSMYAIGTRVELDGTHVVPYRTNASLPEKLLRKLVVAMSRIATHYFPEVLSVIQDLEGDTGMPPVTPMEGAPPLEVSPPPQEQVSPPLEVSPTRRRQRVGYSVDMSCDLGNSSHYDIHDASQGFSVWTEEQPGVAANWYFIMPNVHGMRLDGSFYAGLAIKLHYGTAISWDGRVVRHCTSITMPDGLEGRSPLDSRQKKAAVSNHVYGTFTSAKERIVEAGRRFAAAAAAASKDDAIVVDANHPVSDEAAHAVPIDEWQELDNYVIPKKRRTL